MDKGGVAVSLATISMVGAALLFSAEHARHGSANIETVNNAPILPLGVAQPSKHFAGRD
jgi:hypothetical protein